MTAFAVTQPKFTIPITTRDKDTIMWLAPAATTEAKVA
jgi:hypothetical protein